MPQVNRSALIDAEGLVLGGASPLIEVLAHDHKVPLAGVWYPVGVFRVYREEVTQ